MLYGWALCFAASCQPVSTYPKSSNGYFRAICEICSKLIIKISEKCL